MKNRGTTLVELVVLIALLAGGLWFAKPNLFPGASKRAKESTEATANLEAATTAQGAAAAASVSKIGEANSEAPESPAKSFIGREVPLALSLLPPPNPTALIEAERRRVAVMEGRLDEARRLYETAAAKADRLQRERDEALAARQAADMALEQAAAAEHARTVQALGAGLVALLCLAAFLYLKFTGISPRLIGGALADIHAGATPVQAFDTLLTAAQQRRVAEARKLASP